MTGPAHDRQFTIECRIDAVPDPVTAHGRSRRAGEQRAAELMLAELEKAP